MSRRRNLILVGGIFHDFAASAKALSDVLAPLGIESRIESDLDAGLASLATNPEANSNRSISPGCSG